MNPRAIHLECKAAEHSRLLTFLLILVVLAGCRDEEPVVAEPESEVPAASEMTPPQITDVREILDEIQPAIPLWPGARPGAEAIQRVGERTIVELRTDDPFPMVWHYYVLYLAQYRAWDPLDPFPASGETPRMLELDLSAVMQDPFVPGTEIRRHDVVVRLEIQEEKPPEPVRIRYVIAPAR